MILADTSVWIDHLRKTDELLASLLNTVQIVIHPFIIGELACGNLKNRGALLALLKRLLFFPPTSPRKTI
jgi:predicted nucleic acid-binding protein